MIRRPPRSTHCISSAASDVYKRQIGYLLPKQYRTGTLDPLTDLSIYPTLLILEGSDGSINHAVSTVDHWLFDSNWKRAKRINKKNLDWCVSSSNSANELKRVHLALRFVENPDTKMKRYKHMKSVGNKKEMRTRPKLRTQIKNLPNLPKPKHNI